MNRGMILSMLYAVLKMITPEVFYKFIRVALEALRKIIVESDNKVDDAALPFIDMLLALLPTTATAPTD